MTDRLHRRRVDQRGVTLIEILVAIAILGLTVGGISMATTAMTKGSGSANEIQRAQVLLTAFGESIKNLPYQPCAGAHDPSGTNSYPNYQNLFEQAERSNDPDRNLLGAKSGNDAAVFEVALVDGQVEPYAGCTPASDTGTQRIALRVRLGDAERTGVMTKRNPDALPPIAQVNISFNQQSVSGDPEVTLGLTALVDGSGTPIARFEWYCDGTLINLGPNRPPPDFTSYQAVDPTVVCRYTAPTVAGERARPAVVTTDQNGEERKWTGEYELPTTAAPHDPPLPNLAITSSIQCRNGPAPAPQCQPNTDIRIRSVGADVTGDAVITRFEWDFGDGSPKVVCTALTDACKQQTKRYAGGGSYDVRLTVTDSFGATGATTLTLSVAGAPVVLPTVDFTWSPNGGIAPQAVAFTSNASAPGGITGYAWTFGDTVNNTSTQQNPSHTYANPGTGGNYTVKLTVTAASGATNSVTKTIQVGSLVPPIALANTQARAQRIAIWPFTSGSPATFTFTWFGVPRSPGDTITYEIQIRNAGNMFCEGFGQTVNKSFSIPSTGGAGAFQTYTASWRGGVFSGDFVCRGNYTYQARTIRVPSGGGAQQISAWSASATVNAS